MAQKKSIEYAQAKGAPAGFILAGIVQAASLVRGIITATTSHTTLQDYYLNALTGMVRITAISQGVFVAFSKTANKAPARASGTLTSDNTNPSDNDTATIGTRVYRFKNTLAAVNDVKIGADADATLTSLIKTINGTGVAGTDHFAGTEAHADVFAGTTITAHAFTVYAKAFGTAGNSIASTETSSHLSWGAATLASGAAGNYEDYIPAGATKEYTIDESVSYLSFVGDGGSATVHVVEY